jgi:hypothetical protein
LIYVSEFNTIKLLMTLLLLIKILFCIIFWFWYNSFFDNRELRLSVLQRAKKIQCLEWLDKMDKNINLEPIVIIWWSLVNSFLFQSREHIFHDCLFILWCCRRGYDFDLRLDMLWYAFLRIFCNQTSLEFSFTHQDFVLYKFLYDYFFGNREMHLSVLQRAKKFRCLEWLDKMDKNLEPIILIWWSLVNSFCFNLYRFRENIFHNLLFILWCCRRGYDFDSRLDMLFSEFLAIKLLLTLLLLITILFFIIFWYKFFYW